jgi:hypothetical protein
MLNCQYIPFGNEWADKHYCRDYDAGESIAKSPLLLRYVIVLMGYATLTFLVFPFFGLIKFNMVHNSERKFVEFTTRIMVPDFNQQRVENWNSEHIKAFIASSDKGIGGSHCRDLDKYVNSEELTGLEVLEIVKTQEIVDFYLFFNELAKPLTLDAEGQERTKKRLLHLLGDLFLVSHNSKYKTQIESIYKAVESTHASELASRQDEFTDGKGNKMSIPEYVKLTLQMEYYDEENRSLITYSGLNQLRRFKEKMEYIFDTKNHEQEYKGYGLLKEGEVVHGPGEYKWVENPLKENFKSEESVQIDESYGSFKSDRSSKKKCFSGCTEDDSPEMTNYVRKSDEYRVTYMKEKAIESIKMFDESDLVACTADSMKKKIKKELNEKFSAEDPIRIHKVKRMDGRVWGLMKLKMYDTSVMSNDLVEKTFSFWILLRGNDGEYLKPNNDRVRAVQFPVENPNMNFLEYNLPSPQYDLASSKEKKLSALSESRYNVFPKFCQKINEIHDEERLETRTNLRRMSEELHRGQINDMYV